MRKIIIILLAISFLTFQYSSYHQVAAQAAAAPAAAATTPEDLPIICGCPPQLDAIYKAQNTGDQCTRDYATFKADPTINHLWVEDEEITAQGKTDERARQFLYWTLTHSSIDDHPVLKKLWTYSEGLAFVMVLLVGAVMGLGIIINQRNNFTSSIKVWPSIWKILIILLYIALSATIVITLIQISTYLMNTFIANLGGRDLFNIYFGGADTEKSYMTFVGCRDLNIRVQESVKSEMFLLKLTNVSYYVMGCMLLLRKILLWFLLIVSPFLGILMPFVFIRNIGWIWIGVFLQWLFYGPLLALFLGALSTIWHAGIPFIFDFSRIDSATGYVYPTAINILYAGPAQKWTITNSGNYVDTFTEYVITLIMLWAVIFFPWWLLRIFRDYCCDGINASKNILMSMYDQMRGGPSPAPGPVPTPTNIGTSMNIPQQNQVTDKIKLETIEEIKKTKTEDITRSLNIKASNLTDIAHFETNKELNKTVTKNINYLMNPTQAQTVTERQKYMNIRNELFNRAVKEDVVAKQFLGSLSTSKVEQVAKRQEILKSISQMVPVTHLEAIKVKTTAVPIEEHEQVKKMWKKQYEKGEIPTNENIATREAWVDQGKVKTTAVPTKIPEKSIEQIITIPPSVPIEEYEQVKKMWKKQYEKGEVPTNENIATREAWVDQDTVFITNTLNKLFSPDDKMRQAGLDDVGYILPIFMVNNMKGDQLVVYLKAKLEAAKEVKEMKVKEKEITEKLKTKTEEETVDVAKPKTQEAEKTMEMKEEMQEEIKDEPKAMPSETSSTPLPDEKLHQP